MSKVGPCRPEGAMGGHIIAGQILLALTLAYLAACEYRELEKTDTETIAHAGTTSTIGIIERVDLLPARDREKGQRRLSFLSVRGRKIIDEMGRPVCLRGCNLGSWLLIEPWMLGIDADQAVSEKDLWDSLYARFQSNDVLRLIRLYRRSFILPEDIAAIRAMGLNLVRVPVWWRALLDPAYAGSWDQLDRILDLCESNGVYVVIDLHGAPGGQTSKSEIVGEPSEGGLWLQPENQELTVELWRMIAERYRDRPVVAGYDLLNEAFEPPFNTLLAFYDRLYDAIREVDSRHIIFMEDGFQGLHKFPNPRTMGWSNVVFSFHYYPSDPGESFRAPGRMIPGFARTGIAYQIPLYVGEFNTIELRRGGADLLRRYCEVFEYYGWPWTMWSFKAVMSDRDVNWGVVGYVDEQSPLVLSSITPSELADFILSLRSDRLERNRTMVAALSWRRRWGEEIITGLSGADFVSDLRSAFLLPARFGKLRIEWQWSPPNIGYWGVGDSVVFRLDVPQGGNYELYLVLSHDGEGCKASAFLDGVHLANYPIPPTGSWRRYEPFSLGVWSLEEGDHYLRIRPEGDSESFINLRGVVGILSTNQARQPMGSEIILSPFFAELPERGPFRVEWEQDVPDIGFWRSRAPIRWQIPPVPGGEYEVAVVYSSPHSATRFTLTVDDTVRRDITLHSTGGWHSFRKEPLGTVQLKPGAHFFKVVWQTTSKEGAGNLRDIRLIRAAQKSMAPVPGGAILTHDGSKAENADLAGDR